MRRSRHAFAALAFAGALLVPALPIGAQTPAPEEQVEAGQLDGPAVATQSAGEAPPASGAPAEQGKPGEPNAPQEPEAEQVATEPEDPELDGAAAEPEPAPAKEEPAVRAAASGGVTIRDFEFGPATINIAVGDTVTWTNQGPTEHTATANDGSFDSGILDQGETYSKTFTSAGSFAYICTPHPFMTGRVVVAAASSGGGGGGDTPAPSATPAQPAQSGGGLPNTGVDVAAWAVFGFALFVFGAALHWRLTVE